MSESTERYDRVHALRGSVNPETGKRWTMEAIGRTFTPPLTKQRVKQILDRADRPKPNGRPRKVTE